MNTTAALSAFVVDIRLDRSPARYAPGEALRFQVAIPEMLVGLQSVELSVVWYTTGKGEEDLAVHDFRRLPSSELADGQLAFETNLPLSPLSYAGRAVKVCWATRVRFFLTGGRQMVREASFQLGEVRPVSSDAATPNTIGGGEE